jgi:hypothetical protein
MLWLTWRQHRVELLGTTALLAVIAAALLFSGVSMHDAYHTDGVAGCLSRSGSSQGPCAEIINSFRDRYVSWGDLLTLFNLLPALAGVFIGAPLLARELEHGTWKLAFTQSVTRTRWLATKIAAVGLAIAVFAFGFAAVFTWWRSPLDAIGGRIDPAAFNFEGPSLAAAALFAFAVGTLAGVLFRRTVAAMAVTLLAYFAVRTPVELYVRPRYQTPLLRVIDINGQARTTTDWVLGEGWMDGTGHHLSVAERLAILRQIPNSGTDFNRYMLDHGMRPFIQYQPNARFWTFQLIEAGLFIALAALFVTLAVLLVRRRTT